MQVETINKNSKIGRRMKLQDKKKIQPPIINGDVPDFAATQKGEPLIHAK